MFVCRIKFNYFRFRGENAIDKKIHVHYSSSFVSNLAHSRSKDGSFFTIQSHITPKEYSKKLLEKQLLDFEENDKKLMEVYSKEKNSYEELTVSSYTAKREYKEEKKILFVDIRSNENTSSLYIDRFIHISYHDVRKKISELLNIASNMDVKTIYFLDNDGCDSKVVAAQLSTLEEFKSYDLKAIEGGIFEWFNDLGPVTVADPVLKEVLSPLEEGLRTKPGEYIDVSFFVKLANDCGMNFQPHEIVYQDPVTLNTVENNFDFDRDFLQKINIEEAGKLFRNNLLKKL